MTTIRDICVLLILSGSLAAFGQAASPTATYISIDACKLCHEKPAIGDQWAIWKKSKHAQAYNTLLNSQSQEIATKAGLKTPAAEAPQCLRCHVTGYDYKTKSVSPNIQVKDGVECQACHGPGSLHREDGVALMFHPDEAAKIDISAHIMRPDEKTCVTCHNSESPVWNPERYTSADGKKVGFDYQKAFSEIAHPIPGKAPWIK